MLFSLRRRDTLPPQKFNVGLVQMSHHVRSRRQICSAPIDKIHLAAARGAHIVCLPELFQTQYFCQREDAHCSIWPSPSPARPPNRLAALAKQLTHRADRFAVREARARRVSQHGGRLRRRRHRSAASTARCTSPTIRSTTKSFTSPRAISAIAPSTPLSDAWAPWSAGTSGIPKARA